MNTGLVTIIHFLRSMIMFLFASLPGIISIIFIFFIFFILRVSHVLRQYNQEIKRNNQKNSVKNKVGIVLEETYLLVVKAVTFLPTVLITCVVFILIVGISDAVNTVEEYTRNEKKIHELTQVIKNLNQKYKVAKVSCIDSKDNTMKLLVEAFTIDDYMKSIYSEEVNIRGSEIFIDSIVINFDYSHIESGAKINLALPYRIYSNEIAANNGIPIKIKNDKGIPFIYLRKDQNLFGVDKKIYDERLSELLYILQDHNLSQKEGIRSMYGNALHRIIKKGESFEIWIEQTGGIVIKESF